MSDRLTNECIQEFIDGCDDYVNGAGEIDIDLFAVKAAGIAKQFLATMQREAILEDSVTHFRVAFERASQREADLAHALRTIAKTRSFEVSVAENVLKHHYPCE